MIKTITGMLLALILFLSADLMAQDQLPLLGRMKVYRASEIKASRWSVGGETLDRDYANYDAYKTYLDNLGAKRLRLQGGWARCERERGKYDFSWLDKIVDDARSRGLKPWLQLSYGNPIYPGGGQPVLAGGIPESDEALAAWDAWVKATVNHFKDRVNEWEIWNEPDLSKKFHAKDFVRFYERTAAIVRAAQPSARLIALGLADVKKIQYVDSLLAHLKNTGHVNYVDAITYHGYTIIPEDNYPHFLKLRELVKSYGSRIELWQGENGAPSTPKGEAVGALTKEDWSEITQAKWNLRRMLGDMLYGVDVTSIFQISDMYYGGTDHLVGLNSKGLLKARPDLSIERPKPAYYAYQNTASLFQGKVVRTKAMISDEHPGLTGGVFKREDLKYPAVVLWFANEKPADNYAAKRISLTVSGVTIPVPVLVDLLTGSVYKVPAANFKADGDKLFLKEIPVTDSPVVVTDISSVQIEKVKN